MKKSRLLLTLLASILLLIGVAGIAIACTNEDDNPNQVETGDEVGVYYYDNAGTEYLLSLTDKGNVSLIMGDTLAYGTYVKADKELTFLYSNDIESMKATVNDDYSAISLTYNNVSMSFLRRVMYRVSFDTASGSEVAALDVLNGKTVNKPNDPVREGYSFLGWYKDDAYTAPFMFGSDIVSSAMTLYAHWAPSVFGENVYTIKFSVGDYEGAVDPAPKQTVGGKIYNVETPVRSGYTFVGWWYSATGKADELTCRVNADTVYTESTTLYAVWQGARDGAKLPAPAVDVTENGVSWEPVAGAVVYRVQVSGPNGFTAIDREVPATNLDIAFNLAGSYKVLVTALSGIAGNNSEATSRTYNYNPLARVSLFTVVNSNMLLWNSVDHAEKYLITIDCGNKEHNHNLFDNGLSTYFSFANCEMQQGGIKFMVTAAANGYCSSVSDEYIYDKSLSAIPELRYDELTQTVSWQAVPEAVGYTVTVSCGSEGHAHTEISVVGQTSYCIKECTVPEGGIAVTVTPYTKGYNSPAAAELTVTAAQKSAPATPYNLRIAGSLLSWADVGAEKYVVRIGDKEVEVNTNSLDLSEQDVDWKKGSDYSIGVRAYQGAAASVWSDALEARYLEMTSALAYNKNTVSWQYVIGAKGYEVRVNGGSVVNVAGGANSARVTLTKSGENKIEVRCYNDNDTSGWAEMTVTAYALTFDSRGGQIVPGTNATVYYAVGDEIAFPNVDEILKDGYTLGEFYNTPTGPDGNGLRFTEKSFSAPGDMVLYASWVPKTYKITLDYNNGGTGITEAYVTFGKPFILPTPETVTEGTTIFGGWCANSLGTALSYTDEQGNSLVNWTIPADTVVYAKWLSVYKFEKNAGGSAGYYYTLQAGVGVRKVAVATVPATYKAPGDTVAYPVTQIGTGAFNSCTDVEVINLPNTIETIQPRTFESYTTLREINVYTVEGVSNNTFWSHDHVLMYNNTTGGSVDIWGVPRAIKGTYTISDKVTSIPTHAFYHIALDELRVPASVTYIAKEAFNYCETPKITFLSPEEDEESKTLRLEVDAFYYANKLETITLPAREFAIWDSTTDSAVQDPDFNLQVFRGCSALTNILVDNANTKYQSIKGMLCTKGSDATLLYCPNDRSDTITIPTGIVNIGKRAFSGCRNITKVIIPNWVQEIGEEAFGGYVQELSDGKTKTTVYGCTSLETLVFEGGDGVAVPLRIGTRAFGNKDNSILTVCNQLSTVEFKAGSNVNMIGEYAFARCPITSIILPATLEDMKEGAFYGCDKLETVEYAPDGKEMSVGDQVFANCIKLTTIKLPANITKFEDGVFSGCNNLSRVEVDPDNPALKDIDGVLFSKDETEILFFPFGKEGEYQIPKSVTKISGGAFAGKTNVTDITIGKNVISIGPGAFRNCTELWRVTFEEGGTEELVIGKSAFNSCLRLTSFNLPDRVVEIPERMLFNATGLCEVEIPDSVTKIGDYAFAKVGLSGIEKLVIPASVEEIGIAAFYGSGAIKIEFEDKVSGELKILTAEEKVTKKTTVSIYSDEYMPLDLAKGDSSLFHSSSQLTEVTLPSGLLNMPSGMFQECKALTTVDIPGSIVSMDNAFMNCSSLTTVNFAERDVDEDGNVIPLELHDGTKISKTESSNTTYTYYGVFAGCKNLTTVNLPEGLTRIPDYCFFNCTSLQTIEIPASVQNGTYTAGQDHLTAIGNYAFASGKRGDGQSYQYETTPMMALETVTFAKGGTGDFSLGAYSFYHCPKLKAITLPATLADSYVNRVNPTMEHVSYNDLSKDWKVCGVRTGYQIRSIEEATTNNYTTSYSSFVDCANLAEINVTPGGKYYSSDDGILYNADKTELVFVPHGRTKDVTVPASVELVKNFAFFKNTGVKKVTFAERADVVAQADDEEASAPKYLQIGENAVANDAGAFKDSKVEEVYLPRHLGKITDYAFYNCLQLRVLSFAEGTDHLTEIGKGAFWMDKLIEEIVLPDSVTTIGIDAFKNANKLATFTISENSKLNTIGAEAFFATALEEFYLPPAQSFDLGSGVFKNCTKLTTVHIPNTVTSFSGLFDGSYAISTLDIYTVKNDDGTDVTGSLESKDGVIFVDGGKTLSYYPIGKTDKMYSVPVGVTTIAASAFQNNTYLEEIFIPNTVELILDKAFYMMPSLKKVVFESDSAEHYMELTEDELANFEGDRYVLSGDEYVLDSEGTYQLLPVQELKIGVTVNATTGAVTESAGSTSTGVFSFCQSLEVVNLPARVGHISGYSFYSCIKLHTVTFDANCRLGIMKQCVFALTALQYGGTREQIAANSQNPFVLPSNLTEIDAGATFIDPNKNPFGKVTKLVIPAGVTKVGNYAFQNSQYLEEVEFTGTAATQITTVGTYMFRQCPNLTTVILPNKITTISTSMFADCLSLTTLATSRPAEGQTLAAKITIPSDVTTIGSSAFSGCSSITKVILPASGLTKIDSSAFLKCTELAQITYDESNTEYDLYLPTSVTTLSAGAFAGTAITSAYIPGSVTSLSTIFGDKQTYVDIPANTSSKPTFCTRLTKVVFGTNTNNNTLAGVPSNMFLQLSALEEVELPTQTKFAKINTGAFAYSGLKRITIPANITTLDRASFAYCSRLEKVDFVAGSSALTLTAATQNTITVNATNGSMSNYQYVGVFAYSGAENGRAEAEESKKADFKIDMSPRTVATLGKWTFNNTQNLDVQLSPGTTTIQTLSFQGAEIDRIKIPSKTTTIQIAAFAKSKIKEIEFEASASATALTLAAGTSTTTDTTLGVFAFCDELTKVDMSGRKITAIPKYAFYKCPNIAEFKWSVNAAATADSPMTTHTTTIADYAFEYSFDIEALDIPRGVTSIGQWAFSYGAIGAVKLPNTLTTMGCAAFYETGLKSVEFEEDSVITTFGLDNRNLGWTFGYNTELTTAKLPDSMVTIPANTFYNTGLTEISIPKSVTTIGNYAFGTNPDLKTVTFEKDEDGNCALTTLGNGAFNGTGITSISIPKGVTSLSAYLFGGCKSLASITFEKDEDGNCALSSIENNVFVGAALKSISIPKSVTSIGNYAFSNLTSLMSVTLEKDEEGACALTSLGKGAFYNTGISSFEIPASVTSMNANPFAYCSKLTSLTLEEGNESFVCEGNVIYNDDKSVLLIYAAGVEGTFEIPGSLKEIGAYAFAGSKWAGTLNVTSADFKVGESAFEACGITSVMLGDGAIIESWAFGDSPELTTVTLGMNVSVGASAFENCQRLSSVMLGSNVTIGNQAFAEDAALATVTLPQGTTISLTAFLNSSVDFTENMLKEDTALKYGDLDAYFDGTIVFNDVAAAAAALKNNSELQYVELAEGITSIGDNAFDGITNLKKIIIPSTVTTIGSYAFRNCTSLEEVVFKRDKDGNSGLTEIGIYAFQKTALVNVVIPKSVVKFRYYAFYQCPELKKVEFEAGSAITVFYANSSSGIGTTSDARHFAECPKLETVILPDGCTSIPKTMFENSGIKYITIPATVTGIWKDAFKDCSALETVTFAKNAEGGTAITAISEGAFTGTGIKSIAIPATVKTFGTNVFKNCAALTSVTFDKDEEGNCALTTFGTYMFEGTALTSLSIPKTVTAIPVNLCNGLSTLTSVTFEKDADGNCALTTIGKLAFAGTGITEISIPSTVTEIGGETTDNKAPAGAFYNCASLASITFEKDADGVSKLSKINAFAFSGTAITQISLPASLGYVYYDAFSNCRNLSSVTWELNADGNSASASLYSKAFANCPNLRHFVLGNSVNPSPGAFMGMGSNVTVYVVGLPGPASTWSSSRWLDGCEVKFVWRWSESMGFLKPDGTFENAGN